MARMFKSRTFRGVAQTRNGVPNVTSCIQCGGIARVIKQSWWQRLFSSSGTGLFRCRQCGISFHSRG